MIDYLLLRKYLNRLEFCSPPRYYLPPPCLEMGFYPGCSFYKGLLRFESKSQEGIKGESQQEPMGSCLRGENMKDCVQGQRTEGVL